MLEITYFDLLILILAFAGVFSRGATPDPIPNSEVKPSCGDGIARVTVWESSTAPASFCAPVRKLAGVFFYH